ncbi:MAG TPA: polymer-forming cytoskeletal protein [Terriglobales bacterium]|nr:polymer-forming cytoskeletal protein [Terriglobales bacterium]
MHLASDFRPTRLVSSLLRVHLWRRALALIIGGACLASPALGLERRTGDTVVVAKDETLDDTLIAQADTLRIEGTVTGNVIAFARRVLVTGTVRGDLISFSRDLEMEGRVEGNTFSFAEEADIRREVGRSAMTFARYCRLDREARIAADLLAFCAEAALNGAVGRDASAFASSVDVGGNIERNLAASTGRLTLALPARVGGDLTARVRRAQDVKIESGATVAGRTDIRIRPRRSDFRRAGFYVGIVISIAAAFVTGLILFWLVPTLFGARPVTAGDYARSLGIGFLVCVAIPIAAVIVGITLIGLPIALFSLAAWLAGLYAAKIVIAAIVGRALLRPQPAARPSGRMGDFAVALLVGLVIVYVAMNLPIIGVIVKFLVILTGLGLIAMQVRRRGAAAGTVTAS